MPPVQDSLADGSFHKQDLLQGQPSPIPGMPAAGTALGPVQRPGFLQPQIAPFPILLLYSIRLFAVAAQSPDQKLPGHPLEGRGCQIGFHPHVQDPVHRSGCSVGVKGAQDPVPGKRRLDGHGGGFPVPDFPNQDAVRILAQDTSETAAEGQADFGPDGHLADSRQLILHRVFHGNDF